MILCKTSPTMRKRQQKTICITLEEMPKRPEYVLKSNADWKKVIKKAEMMIRSSLEYRQYMKFLKDNMDFNRCAIFHSIASTPEKHYSIEIHHSPLTLFEITQIVIAKHLEERGEINLFRISQEVMQLHYDGKIGLIPLTATAHELVHNGKIFIPLTQIYQDYVGFVDEYEPWILDTTKDKLLDIADATIKILNGRFKEYGDCLKTEFVYLNVDGFEYPVVPEEWGKRTNVDSIMNEEYDEEGDGEVVYRIGDEIPQGEMES